MKQIDRKQLPPSSGIHREHIIYNFSWANAINSYLNAALWSDTFKHI